MNEETVAHEEISESGTIICNAHPFSNNQNQNPGGICAFCLQEKLGNLVSSSFPITVFPSSSSCSSSFRSDFVHHKNGAIPKINHGGAHFSSSSSSSLSLSSRRARIFPFLLTHKKKKQREVLESSIMNDEDNGTLCFSDLNRNINLRRSKSTVSSRRNGFMGNEDHLPSRKGFWSFFNSTKSAKMLSPSPEKEQKQSGVCKVSRSRSVGCGSRSFSGDFFERISTGLGDCTLRRVESQREAKQKALIASENHNYRVKCGGMFRGFSMTASPEETNGKSTVEQGIIPADFNRNKKWGWVFASPIRAFSSSSKHGIKSNKNTIKTPDLSAVPSLLNVRT